MEELQRGDVLNGRYRIEKVLGQGAMGAVYLARDLTLSGARWAIKTLSVAELPPSEAEEARSLFLREMDLLTRLRHPGLPRVVDTFSQGERHHMVMELIPGETLEDLMARRSTPFSEMEILAYLQQLAAVLHFLHTQPPHPVVFRDLKPSNVMVTAEGKVQLIDFGIARHYKPGRKSDTIVIGTPGFCAPEQYGGGQTDPRTDLYALGAMAWHLMSGADPAAVGFAFPPLRSVAPHASRLLEGIVARCLALSPQDRYPSAAELLADLAFAASPDGARLERDLRSGSPSSPALPLVRAVGGPTRRMASSLLRLGSHAPIAAPSATAPSTFAPIRPLHATPSVDASTLWKSWAHRTFQVWWGPGSIHLPRIIALMILMVFLIPFVSLVHAQSRVEPMAQKEKCVSNLAEIRGALIRYREAHGRFPRRLTAALEVPWCPASRADYSVAYDVSRDGQRYTLSCSGGSHEAAGLPPDYPRISSETFAVMERPGVER